MEDTLDEIEDGSSDEPKNKKSSKHQKKNQNLTQKKKKSKKERIIEQQKSLTKETEVAHIEKSKTNAQKRIDEDEQAAEAAGEKSSDVDVDKLSGSSHYNGSGIKTEDSEGKMPMDDSENLMVNYED